MLVLLEQRRTIERLLTVRALIVAFPLGFAHVIAQMFPQIVQSGEFLAAHFARKQILGNFPAAGMIQVTLEVVLPGEIFSALQTRERFAHAVRHHMLVEDFFRGTLGIALRTTECARIGVDGLQVSLQIVVRFERFGTQLALDVTDVRG